MISIETFTEIRERFGHFASWAVWQKKEFRIVRIPHYASYVSKENYRTQVRGQLPDLPTKKEPR
jgi:hypothetical protein